ncbi:hypothetical protein O59_003654 [Cellvibrio sp. BR]|nr:hypothetical protein O59_003654 [Cellvibrio sp. BR]
MPGAGNLKTRMGTIVNRCYHKLPVEQKACASRGLFCG